MYKNYYMIRILKNQFNLIEPKSVVAVGWSGYNFAETEEESLIEQINRDYTNLGYKKQMCSKISNQIKKFINIKKGDYIVVPHFDSIWLAVSEGDYIYDEAYKAFDLANQLKVNFLKGEDGTNRCIPRTQLSNQLFRRLKSRGITILDLNKFGDEIEELIFNNKK